MGMNGITAQMDLARALERLKKGSSGGLSKLSVAERDEVSGLLNLIPDGAELQKAKLIEIDLERLKRGKQESWGRRLTPRYALRAPAIILSNQSSFKTTTVNISQTGVLVKDPLPKQFRNKELHILIKVKDSSDGEDSTLVFRAKPVQAEPLVRFAFEATNPKNERIMQHIFSELTQIREA
jgi:hypothetical protein